MRASADATNHWNPGLHVGATAPDFSLPDQEGKMRSLSELFGSHQTIILFHRSASW